MVMQRISILLLVVAMSLTSALVLAEQKRGKERDYNPTKDPDVERGYRNHQRQNQIERERGARDERRGDRSETDRGHFKGTPGSKFEVDKDQSTLKSPPPPKR